MLEDSDATVFVHISGYVAGENCIVQLFHIGFMLWAGMDPARAVVFYLEPATKVGIYF